MLLLRACFVRQEAKPGQRERERECCAEQKGLAA
jgi:hypothetical protein